MKSLFTLFLLASLPMIVLADISAALNHPDRSAEDKARDENRKPAEVLAFLGLEPGMSVIDIFGGGGYYTEIVSRFVGDEGFVTLYNNTPWDRLVAKAVDERLKDKRLPNVDRLVSDPEDLWDLPDQYDVGLFVLGMHDVYYGEEETGWRTIDKARFLAGIYKVIADGGVLLVIDHNAKSGSDPAVTGKTLHRVDPAVIKRDLTAVGFTLEAESDILGNPDDTLEASSFDPAIRHKTDRSVMKFRK